MCDHMKTCLECCEASRRAVAGALEQFVKVIEDAAARTSDKNIPVSMVVATARALSPDPHLLERERLEARKELADSIRATLISDQATGAADHGEAEEYADNILRSAGYMPSGEALAKDDR